ncbi:hypothetical protein [Chryseobacterium sp. MA9]|uniref:hypothetical protein n=1 Tax=Chryseobacterium sp. MA9 TaxID=2966625 RepID=UPI002106EFB2|nr:hypothetical protein [Chryseobacterium sp. MA9]UTX46718.1 hypothetical protein KIK00_12165 [Chryseobacterium sp. MA9]
MIPLQAELYGFFCAGYCLFSVNGFLEVVKEEAQTMPGFLPIPTKIYDRIVFFLKACGRNGLYTPL